MQTIPPFNCTLEILTYLLDPVVVLFSLWHRVVADLAAGVSRGEVRGLNPPIESSNFF